MWYLDKLDWGNSSNVIFPAEPQCLTSQQWVPGDVNAFCWSLILITVTMVYGACAGNAGNVFPTVDFKGYCKLMIPACITARACPLSATKPIPQLQSSQSDHRGFKNGEMYVLEQIKVCVEYRDLLPRPRLNLPDTPRFQPIGPSPGSWQSSHDLGGMSQYYAKILMCIS